jgi:DNA repair exonuclease SbcCD ATPase subunit
MKIIELVSQNVKKIKAVQINPTDNMVVISGNNGQGKSSVLDSIAYTLGGKDLCPDAPIRTGEKNAMVRVDIGDYIVKRKWYSDKSVLEVENRDGAKYGSPQAILDGIIGKLSFDPLAFVNYDSKRQMDLMKKLTGTSEAIEKIDKEYNDLFAKRADLTKEGKSLKSQIDAMADEKDVPHSIVDTKELTRLLNGEHTKNKAIELENKKIEQLRQRVDLGNEAINQKKTSIETNLKEIEGLKSEIVTMQKEMETYSQKILTLEQAIADTQSNVKKMEPGEPGKIINRIENAGEDNRRFNAFYEKQTKIKLHSKLQDEYKNICTKLEELKIKKEEVIKSAKFPVDGITFGGDGLMLNGLPFEQSSSAEKLLVSAAMGIALNPKLRVLLLRDGSLLDENSMKSLADFADKNDCQIWIERVGKDQKSTVIIEDGEIVK